MRTVSVTKVKTALYVAACRVRSQTVAVAVTELLREQGVAPTTRRVMVARLSRPCGGAAADRLVHCPARRQRRDEP
jgi:hypothetical protein